MKSPQKQNQNRKGATASAGGFMVPCFSLPDPNPASPSILPGKVTGAIFLPPHRTASQWSQENGSGHWAPDQDLGGSCCRESPGWCQLVLRCSTETRGHEGLRPRHILSSVYTIIRRDRWILREADPAPLPGSSASRGRKEWSPDTWLTIWSHKGRTSPVRIPEKSSFSDAPGTYSTSRRRVS